MSPHDPIPTLRFKLQPPHELAPNLRTGSLKVHLGRFDPLGPFGYRCVPWCHAKSDRDWTAVPTSDPYYCKHCDKRDSAPGSVGNVTPVPVTLMRLRLWKDWEQLLALPAAPLEWTSPAHIAEAARREVDEHRDYLLTASSAADEADIRQLIELAARRIAALRNDGGTPTAA